MLLRSTSPDQIVRARFLCRGAIFTIVAHKSSLVLSSQEIYSALGKKSQKCTRKFTGDLFCPRRTQNIYFLVRFAPFRLFLRPNRVQVVVPDSNVPVIHVTPCHARSLTGVPFDALDPAK